MLTHGLSQFACLAKQKMPAFHTYYRSVIKLTKSHSTTARAAFCRSHQQIRFSSTAPQTSDPTKQKSRKRKRPIKQVFTLAELDFDDNGNKIEVPKSMQLVPRDPDDPPITPDEIPPSLGDAPRTMLELIRRATKEHHKFVVLTQVGSFYELYFEQAEEYGPKLGLRVAKKKTGVKSNGEEYPMAGFPIYQLDKYLRILVQELRAPVVIYDQYDRDLSEDQLQILRGPRFDRQPTRFVTPGTLIDESFIDWKANNYLLAVALPEPKTPLNLKIPRDEEVGLAWVNLGLGTFFVESTTMTNLVSLLARIQPSEVLLDKSISMSDTEELVRYQPELAGLETFYVKHESFKQRQQNSFCASLFEQDENSMKQILNGFTPLERHAIIGILKYVKTNLPKVPFSLQLPEHKNSNTIMKIDMRSRNALELLKPLREGYVNSGTLLSSIKNTVSDSGTRLLTEWIKEPSLDIAEITLRHDAVDELQKDALFLSRLRDYISSTEDPARIVQKFGLGKGTIFDLYTLAQDLEVFHKIREEVKSAGSLPKRNSKLKKMFAQFVTCNDLTKTIINDIHESALLPADYPEDSDVPAGINDLLSVQEPVLKKSVATSQIPKSKYSTSANDIDEWLIKPTASKNMTKLHNELDTVKLHIATLEDKLKERYKDSSLTPTLKWNSSIGYHIHLSGKIADSKIHPEDIQAIITKGKGTATYHNAEWLELGPKADKARADIRQEEKKIMNNLKQKVLHKKKDLIKNCQIIDRLDVLCGFALLARERGLVRPTITDSKITKIEKGRHMFVEQGLHHKNKVFTPNDCLLGSPEFSNTWIITGPNMGGKSTFLRQVALISVLGQVGCFVPASHAELGLVDQIFCRVGAGDSLFNGESTFMVEMKETINILNNATDRSLAILDEVGRGTSNRDGVSIAFATLMHLSQINKCRTLFATHFGPELHALINATTKADESLSDADIDYYCTQIETPGVSKFQQQALEQETADGEEHVPATLEDKFFNESVVFDHKLVRGICDDSHGLRIAVLAKIPRKAFDYARLALNHLPSPTGANV